MQLLADTSGLRVSVPDSTQVPARGAALFGAVAAGALPRHRRGDRRDATADRAQLRAATPARERSTIGSTLSTAACTSGSGARDAELLHGLKRIYTERRAS